MEPERGTESGRETMENDLRDAGHLSLVLHQGPQTAGGMMHPVTVLRVTVQSITLPSQQLSSTNNIAIKIGTQKKKIHKS